MYFSAIKLKLYPNLHQQMLIRQSCGCARWVYNHFLGQSIADYNNDGRKFDRYELQKELPSLKITYPWLKTPDSQSLQCSLQDLSVAYDRFFKKLSFFPKFKAKFKSKESFRMPQNIKLNPNTRLITLPKIGEIHYRCDNERWRGVRDINSVTVSIEAGNNFYASCLIEVPDFHPIQHPYPECGIDLGVKRPLTVVYHSAYGHHELKTSVFGVKFSENLKKKEDRRKHYQRSLSRKVKGSNNRTKARYKVARCYQKERFYRQNWIEQTSHALSSKFQVIKFEDLKISNMTKSNKGTAQNPGTNVKAKSGLNREMLRLGLSNLVLRTEQKSMTNGGQVVYIDPRFTSQKCSCCGNIDKKSRVSQSRYHCVSCGEMLNADTNAARNILRKVA